MIYMSSFQTLLFSDSVDILWVAYIVFQAVFFLGHTESPLSITFYLHVCFIDIRRKKSPAWKMGKLSSLNTYLNTPGFLS